MEPIAFCSQCRGMKVGWNRTYILHSLICREIILKSVKLVIFATILSSIIFAFPITTWIALSDSEPPQSHMTVPVVETKSLPMMDPAVRTIEQFFGHHGVEFRQRNRIAKAIVQSAKTYNVDPKLVAAIVI